ncbi:MAG: hypothetical protein D6784_02655 [Chloroflexi bacterium]|nr:MAG: hypothetical protein D6784_02655 [Chloroflexota bacterium]
MSPKPASRTRLSIPLILALAAWLRFYRLAGQSLWSDEGNSAALAEHTFAEIARRTAFDIHPPLYYWLLKIWTAAFSSTEAGLRSLSAVLGVGLVWLVWRLGRRMFGPRVGLLAAALAAVSPFQVYYSQEARMYILLTLLAAVAVYTAHRYFDTAGPAFWPLAGYAAAATAGLYTHYAFPLVPLTVNLAALGHVWQNPADLRRKAAGWLAAQAVPAVLYLPWLPIAWRQVTTWPAERAAVDLPAALHTTAATLLFGLSWPWATGWGLTASLAALLLVSLTGIRRGQNTRRDLLLVWLWLLLPVVLTLVIYSPAFLKFLLVAGPALALLLALSLVQLRRSLPGLPGLVFSAAALAALAGGSALALYHYYTNPAFARDDYRGIVAFIKAVSGPDDAVILNAEGQQDVFGYYYRQPPPAAAKVYPLPRRRPLDQTATVQELAQIAARHRNVYAVYWAQHQADPQGLIEGWLNQNLYKATDRWYGNVRLVSYAGRQVEMNRRRQAVNVRLGEHIRLVEVALSGEQVVAGDILQVELTWQTDAALSEPYTVFVQALDGAGHLAGQRDASPATPTTDWTPAAAVVDRHGLFIEPGTPPGRYRLIAGLYHSATGQRLPQAGSRQDFVELGEIEVVRPEKPFPPEALRLQVRSRTPVGGATLLGYDLYKPGYRSTPETPLYPGDPLHVTLYWQAGETAASMSDQMVMAVETIWGQETGLRLTAPPAGVDYPPRQWQAGEVVRAQFDLWLTGLAPGVYRLRFTWPDERGMLFSAYSRPFRVSPENQ